MESASENIRMEIEINTENEIENKLKTSILQKDSRSLFHEEKIIVVE